MDVRRVLQWVFGAFAVWWFLLGAPVAWYAWQDYLGRQSAAEHAQARCVDAFRTNHRHYVDELGRQMPLPGSVAECGLRPAYEGHAAAGIWKQTAFIAFFPILIYVAGRLILGSAHSQAKSCAR